ncbi:SRPBCC family protein [bacterium]|nr:SRPBCC family protein [bacterium]
MHILETEQLVPRPIKEVFAFFSKPENLAEITPASMGFRTLTPSPIQMKEGALIDYTIRLGGLPLHWRTMISDYTPPFRFVDEQLAGPYTFWHHTHTFEEVEGGTMIRDTVRYLLPFGPLGKLVHALFVRRQIESIFTHRQRVIRKQFG